MSFINLVLQSVIMHFQVLFTVTGSGHQEPAAGFVQERFFVYYMHLKADYIFIIYLLVNFVAHMLLTRLAQRC